MKSYSTYDKMSQENRRYLESLRERADSYESRDQQIEEYKIRAGVKDEE